MFQLIAILIVLLPVLVLTVQDLQAATNQETLNQFKVLSLVSALDRTNKQRYAESMKGETPNQVRSNVYNNLQSRLLDRETANNRQFQSLLTVGQHTERKLITVDAVSLARKAQQALIAVAVTPISALNNVWLLGLDKKHETR